MEHKDLVRDTLSAWYELSVRDKKTLVVRVHRRAFEHIASIHWGEAPIVLDAKKEGLGDFLPPSEETPWGLGKIFVPESSSDPAWVTWRFTLPVLVQRRREYIWGRACSLRASLAILFLSLEFFHEDTGAGRPQLLVMDSFLAGSEGIYGGALSAVVTPGLASWIHTCSDERFVETAQVIVDTFHYMDPSLNLRLLQGWVRVARDQSRRIHLDVPGNACGLDPDTTYGSQESRGYQLIPHNTDNPLQQLSLLVGLAKLCDLARKEGA